MRDINSRLGEQKLIIRQLRERVRELEQKLQCTAPDCQWPRSQYCHVHELGALKSAKRAELPADTPLPTEYE